jgi:shikimate kinase
MSPTFRTSQPVSAADPAKPHAILVGLPGAGKSTVGFAVAERLNRSFLDFDKEIERRELQSINEIFAAKGEPYFRQLERQLTEELREVGNMILSPGGGWVANPEVVRMLRPPGQLIYLKVRPETALKRLGSRRMTRPLLMRPDPVGELKRLLTQRNDAYEGADHTIDTERFDSQRVIEKVAEIVQQIALSPGSMKMRRTAVDW